MNSLIKLTLIKFFVSISSILYAQQFSDDIIIQGPQPNEWFKSAPVIDIDSQGNIGIVWANNYNDHYTINFVRSTDGGNTFDSIRVVEDIPYDPDWGGWFTPAIVYDAFDNPLVFYYSYLAPFTDHFRLKKSLDGGDSFPSNYQYFNGSGGYHYGFMLSDSGVGYLAIYQGLKIKIFKTYDYGLSFLDSTIINTDNFGVLSKIQIIQCGNGDLLCFWDGQDQTTHRNTIFYNRSSDNGITFSPKIEIDSTSQSPVKVNAIANQNNVFVLYRGLGDSTNHQLLYRKSEDFGYTFSDLNIFYTFGSSPVASSLTTLRYISDVGLCIAWNHMNSEKKIMFTRSNNFGDTFDSSSVVVEGARIREWESMAVSDSGYIFIVSKEVVASDSSNIVLNKMRIPTLTNIRSLNYENVKNFKLTQNYPNPFNSFTQFIYKLNKISFVTLKIYNLLGQEIDSLVNKEQIKGHYKVNWNAKMLPSGIYFVQLLARSSNEITQSETIKILLIK